MAKTITRSLKTPLPTDHQAIERYALLDRVIRQPTENIGEMEKALGMYLVGFHFGWKVLYALHSKSTIRKYEAILGISVRDTFDEFGPDADRTNAFQLIQSVSSFWAWVSDGKKSALDIDRRVAS
jgi:hypothetical protein